MPQTAQNLALNKRHRIFYRLLVRDSGARFARDPALLRDTDKKSTLALAPTSPKNMRQIRDCGDPWC